MFSINSRISKTLQRQGLVITLLTSLVSAMAFSNIALASDAHITSYADRIAAGAAVIHELEIIPIPAGINPDYFAYIIKGRVEIAGNPCMAMGRKVEMKVKNFGKIQFVFAELESKEFEKLCTMEYAPVFVDVAKTVRGSHSNTDEIFILNVDEPLQHERFNP